MNTPRHAPIDLAPADFRSLGHTLVDRLADFLQALPTGRVTSGETPERVRQALDAEAALPEEGRPAGELLTEASRLLFDHSLFNGHPRFYGYVTASPAPLGMLADLLASAVNPNVGAWQLSPMATEIEGQTMRWLAALIGYPASSAGLLVSGGNMANIVGLLAARAARSPWDVRSLGVAPRGAPRLRVYASRETHTWLQKAVDMAGLGGEAVRWLPTDAQQRLDCTALGAAIADDRAAGDLPLLVVASAGTVSTGAVDPIRAMAALCEREGLWLHVDGAYGACAAAADDPEVPDDLRALGLADSVALDPHKWLYAPLEAGGVLVRNAESLRAAFSYHPPYYHFGQEATNYFDLGPQNSRGFRALKVWLMLQQVGRQGYARMIGDDMRLSRQLHEAVARTPGLEPCTQSLSISTFRYVPPDLRVRRGDAGVAEYLDTLNRALLDRIQGSGEAFVSNAVVQDRFVLRACIVNFRTSREDVLALPPLVVRLGREEDVRLRGAGAWLPGERRSA